MRIAPQSVGFNPEWIFVKTLCRSFRQLAFECLTYIMYYILRYTEISCRATVASLVFDRVFAV